MVHHILHGPHIKDLAFEIQFHCIQARRQLTTAQLYSLDISLIIALHEATTLCLCTISLLQVCNVTYTEHNKSSVPSQNPCVY